MYIDILKQRVCDEFKDHFKIDGLDDVRNCTDEFIATCPMHGEFITSISRLLTQKSGCQKCSGFRNALSKMFGKDEAYAELKKIYKFCWDNPRIVEYINNSVNSDYDKLLMIYDGYIKKADEYVSPKVQDFSFNRTYHGRKKNRDCTQALADLNSIYRGAYEFPYIETEFINAASHITAICPVHGAFSSTFTRLFNIKNTCIKCKARRWKFNRKHGKDVGFEKMIDHYLALKKAKDNDSRSSESVTHMAHPSLKLNQTIADNNNNVSVISDNAEDLMPEKSVNHQQHKSVSSNVINVIDSLRNISVDDVKSVSFEVDLENDSEITVIMLKDGKTITING